MSIIIRTIHNNTLRAIQLFVPGYDTVKPPVIIPATTTIDLFTVLTGDELQAAQPVIQTFVDNDDFTVVATVDTDIFSPVGGVVASPGGSDTDVQVNVLGTFGGSSNLTFDGSTLKINNGPVEIHNVPNLPGHGDLTFFNDAPVETTIESRSSDGSVAYGNLFLGSAGFELQSNLGNGSISVNTDGAIKTWSFNLDGSLTAAGSITNVTDPVNPQDAATKKYVDTNKTLPAGSDTQIQYNNAGAFGADPSLTLNVSEPELNLTGLEPLYYARIQGMGGNVGGLIVSNQDGSAEYGAILVRNDVISTSVSSNGGPVQLETNGGTWVFDNSGVLTTPGTVNLNGNGIINLLDPVNSQDAATKNYVDTHETPPAGAATQVQFNNGGVFGASPNLTWDGTTLASTELTTGESNLIAASMSQTAGGLQTAISGAVALVTLPNGQALLCGGAPDNTGFNASPVCELYNPITQTWTLTGSMNAARAWNINTVTGGAQGKRVVVLTTGSDAGNAFIVGGDGGTAEIYNVGSGTWSTTASIPGGNSRDIHAAVLQNGKILAWDMTGTTPQVFDPVSHTWAATSGPIGSFNLAGHGQLTTLQDGTVLFTGGVQSFSSDTTAGQYYNPGTNTWIAVGNQVHARRQYSAAVLMADGRVLITGGNVSGSGVTATAEIYDPILHSFTATANTMTHAREYHIALLLPNGKVWIYGGVNDTSSEIYDPVAGTFTADLSSVDNGWWRAGAFLQNGSILLAGESGGGGAPQTGTELYSPATMVMTGINFRDSGSNQVTISAPVTLSSSYAVQMPVAQGANNTVVTNNGQGQLSFSLVDLTASVSGILPVVNGGTGTPTPGLIAGTNIDSITGTWPNQTINASAQITPPAGSNNQIQYSEGGAFAASSKFTWSDSDVTLGLNNDGGSSIEFFNSDGVTEQCTIGSNGIGNHSMDLTAGTNVRINSNNDVSDLTWTFDNAGTLTTPGSINVSGYAITSVLDPVNPQDAATKNYVDGAAHTVAGSTTQIQYNNAGAFAADPSFTYTILAPGFGSDNILQVQAPSGSSAIFTLGSDTESDIYFNSLTGTNVQLKINPSDDNFDIISFVGNIQLQTNGGSTSWAFDTAGTLTAPGNILPLTDAAFDLGNGAIPKRWNNMFAVQVNTSGIYDPTGTLKVVTIINDDPAWIFQVAPDLSGNRITSVADPVAPQDAATKAYVDASVVVPAAPVNSLQFNNAGAFGGSANLTYDGTTLSSKSNLSVATVNDGSGNITFTSYQSYGGYSYGPNVTFTCSDIAGGGLSTNGPTVTITSGISNNNNTVGGQLVLTTSATVANGTAMSGGGITLTTATSTVSGVEALGGGIVLTTGDCIPGFRTVGGGITLTSGQAGVNSGGSITLTSFTPANGGNLILTGTGPTHGAITAGGNMSIDGTTLHVDSVNHNVGVGTATPDISASVDITSTSRGFLPPRMTSAQRDAISTPAEGLMIYNTDDHQWEGWNGTSWAILG